MTGGWKKLVQAMVTAHTKDGASLILQDGRGANPDDCEELPGPTYAQDGRGLTPKLVQTWLYEQRQHAREATCLWSVYDEETNKSVVGFGRVRTGVNA